MTLQQPSPAGEGGAGRVCLAAGARSILSRVALAAQCPIVFEEWPRDAELKAFNFPDAVNIGGEAGR